MKYFIPKIVDVKFSLEQNNVNSVLRSHLHVMAHVIFKDLRSQILYVMGCVTIVRNCKIVITVR